MYLPLKLILGEKLTLDTEILYNKRMTTSILFAMHDGYILTIFLTPVFIILKICFQNSNHHRY